MCDSPRLRARTTSSSTSPSSTRQPAAGHVAERSAGARVGGEDDALADPSEAVNDPREPLGPDVRLAVDRRHDVPARLEVVLAEDPRTFTGDRSEREAGVGHDVADDVDA